MSSSDAVPAIVDLTGPLLIGHLVSWALFGALTVQVYIYYLSFPKDTWPRKAIVAFVYTLEILQIVLSARDAFRDYGSGWGDIIGLSQVGWMWFSVPIMSAIISLTVQSFYAWRVWSLRLPSWGLRGGLIIPVIIMVFALTQFVAAVYSGVHARILGVWPEVQEHLFPVSAVWLTNTAACDILIATSMTYCLNYRAQGGLQETNAMVTRIIRLVIETGTVCATFATVDLGLFIHFKYNNLDLPMCMTLALLYANSLMMVFNSRVKIQGGRNTSADSDAYSCVQFSSVFDSNPRHQSASRHGSTLPSRLTRSGAQPIEMKAARSTNDLGESVEDIHSSPVDSVLPKV